MLYILMLSIKLPFLLPLKPLRIYECNLQPSNGNRILPPCNYCHHPWCVGDKSYHKALLIMFSCDGISDHGGWNDVFHYRDTKFSCSILLQRYKGASINCWRGGLNIWTKSTSRFHIFLKPSSLPYDGYRTLSLPLMIDVIIA